MLLLVCKDRGIKIKQTNEYDFQLLLLLFTKGKNKGKNSWNKAVLLKDILDSWIPHSLNVIPFHFKSHLNVQILMGYTYYNQGVYDNNNYHLLTQMKENPFR